MKDRAPEGLAVAAATLILTASGVLLLGSLRSARAEVRSADFQRTVGGLGGGTAISLADCGAAFDPGPAGGCGFGEEPAPGGFAFCPHHSGPTLRR